MSQPKPVNPLLIVFLVVLTAFAGYTAVKIEILNAEAGYYLPRQNDDEYGRIKWRVAREESVEKSMRQELLARRYEQEGIERGSMDYVVFDRQAAEMELTPSERAELEERIRASRANTNLRDAVDTIGLLQHPAVLLGIIVAIACYRNSKLSLNILAGVCLLVFLLAGFLMIYRQYFISLGA